MNPTWNIQCLDGTWDLYLAENKAVKGTVLPTSSAALSQSGYLKVAGRVPGNFELDLQNAGLIPDLFFGENTLLAQELEDRHLWYTRTFSYNGNCPERMWLNFEGIDTVAEVYLNGQKLGDADNMFIAHEWQATGLKPGKNELVVHIRPAVLAAREREMEPFVISALPYNYESLTLRKAAHSFGWDIMPRIVSAGLWRSVYLYERPADYLEETYLYTVKATEDKAEIYAYYRAHAETSDCNRDYTLRLTGACGDSRFSAERKLWSLEGTFGILIDQPHLWWPRDMGPANLYDVTAELLLDGSVVDRKKFSLGIRTVHLDYTDTTDVKGSGEFRFLVNGEPVFIRGTNWVPLDAFHSRDKDRLPMALSLLEESGCNALRCWGGNVYEDHAFFDFCDRHGILIWQDFAMGCATYPNTEQLMADLKTEAIAVVKKLRQHASLAIWAGDNECDECAACWGTLRRNPDDNKLTRDILPEVIRRQDPSRQFLPSSPYISGKAFESGHGGDTPERHLWGPRDYYKSDFYTTAVAHFASETGYHGCNAPDSVRRFISANKQFPWQDNMEWVVHAAEMDPYAAQNPYSYRIKLMANQVEVLFGTQPDCLADYALASQISQSEAMKFFVERFRTAKWRRTGIIWWNLLDGWPQFSDAVTDYYGLRKLAFHTLRRAQEPICLMFREPENGRQTLVAANETREEVTAAYTVRDLSNDQTVLTGTVTVPANGLIEAASLPEHTGDATFYLIEWTVGGKTCRNHYVTGRPPYDFDRFVAWLRKADMLDADGF